MATVYAVPEEVNVPEFNFETWKEDEEKFTKELRNYCHQCGEGKYVGKILRIPHADGHAQYMIGSEKPLSLIHIPIGDAWDSPMVDGLTNKKIKEMIDGEERLAKFFS